MSDQDFQLCWGQHQQDTAQALKSLWQSEELLDVTLACDDDQIAAHKVVLSSASPFFRNILKRNPHSHPLLYIKGATKKNMQGLLNFIYSGEAQVHQEDINEFMALANSLDIKGLAEEDFGKEKRDEEVIEASKNPPEPKTVSFSKKKRKKVDFAKGEGDIKTEQPEECQEYASDSVVENEGMDRLFIDNLTDTSMTEYDEKVNEMMTKHGSGWDCVKCGHTAKKKAHLEEHVQKHIEGYSFKCNTCTSTFGRKYTLRHHARRCKGSYYTDASKTPNVVESTDLVIG